MKVGDRVRDWQGAVEGCGIGTVEIIDGGVATVRFSNVVADLPVSHLEVVVTKCQCESSLCTHPGAQDDKNCPSTDTRPAPVMYLGGSPMCDPCIDHYIAAGYGLPKGES